MTINRKQKWEEKQLHGRFKWLIRNISHKKTWMWLRKGNLKRETESLLIAAQNNVIRTNHIKARIDKTQQNSKCRLCCDRDETINRIISECSKLAQKEYKTWHDWVGKVIHKEMCKKLKFDQTNKCTTQHLSWRLTRINSLGLWHTNVSPNLGQKTRPYNNQQKKKKRTWKIGDFAVSADHRIKLKECEKKDNYLDLAGNWKNYGTWKWQLDQS